MEIIDSGNPIADTSDKILEEGAEEDITSVANSITSTDYNTQLEAVTKLKDLLVKGNFTYLESLVEQVIHHGILGHLAQIIKTTDDFLLKYRSMWCFVNICCGNTSHVSHAIDTGILDLVFGILKEALSADSVTQDFLDLVTESVWLLGNIAGDTVKHRETCLEHDAANEIVKLVHKYKNNAKLLEHGTWALQNIVSKKPAPFWNQIEESFKLFLSLVEDTENSTTVLYNSLWGLCYMSSSYPFDIVNSGKIPLFVKYLGNSESKLVFPALQIIGNILSSTKDHYTDEVLKQKEFIPLLFKLSESEHQRIKIYATWALSNIAAGSPDQISQIIEHPEYIDILNNQLKSTDDKIKYQASCVLANLVFRASLSQIETLVTKNNYLDALLEIMKQPELRTYERNMIEPINSIMKHDSQHKFAPIFKQKGLIEQMQNIHSGLGFEMRTIANDLMNKHFLNIPAPTATTQLNVPRVTFDLPASPSRSPARSPGRSPARSPKTVKTEKPAASKKIKKTTKPKVKAETVKANPKQLIKRTKTMQETLKAARDFTKGIGKKRTRSGAKPAGLTPTKEILKGKPKMRRTNTMKQTLKEAKKILKQIESTQRSTRSSSTKK